MTISGSVSVAASSIQFKVDGNNVGAPLTVTGGSFSLSLDTASLANGTHVITAVASNSGGSTASASISANVNNVPPTISITFPASGSIVGGTATVTVTSGNDIDTFVNAQLQVDGKNVGSPVSFSALLPQSVSLIFDTTQFSNGSHSVSVTATTFQGASVSSPSISIEVFQIRQWRMSITSGTNSMSTPSCAEFNVTQDGAGFNVDNPQNSFVFSAGGLPPCDALAANIDVTTFGTATFGIVTNGPSNSGNSDPFSLSFTGGGVLMGNCLFGLPPSECSGLASLANTSITGLFVDGRVMSPFTGTYTGTLSYAALGTENISVTLVQNPDYTLSVSYTDPAGVHTTSGNVIGGMFHLNQGFDGKVATAVAACTGPNGPNLCTTFVINVFDSAGTSVGTLQ